MNSQGQATGTAWQVNLVVRRRGREKFANVTTRLASLTDARNQFAIVLDGLVVSAPRTRRRSPAGRPRSPATSPRPTPSAGQPAEVRRPADLVPEQTEQNISATLGGEQLQRGLLAGLIGLVLVVLYSLLQYRALGLVTVASLIDRRVDHLRLGRAARLAAGLPAVVCPASPV